MKTQVGETKPICAKSARHAPPVSLMVGGQAALVANCAHCGAGTVFSAHQVAAAQRVWRLGSGQDGAAALEFLGGDGTTNQCGCGMECEVVFTAETRSEAHWRRSRFATSA